jgi:hypothetical protein
VMLIVFLPIPLLPLQTLNNLRSHNAGYNVTLSENERPRRFREGALSDFGWA